MSAYQFPAATPTYPPAGPADPTAVIGRRIGAWLVDLVLYLLIMSFVGPTPLSPLAEYVDTGDRPGIDCDDVQDLNDVSRCVEIGDRLYFTSENDTLVQLGVFALVFLGYSALQGLTGRSPGKAVFGLKVVDEQGRVPGFGRSLLRTVLWVVDGLPYCILGLVGFITGLTTKGHRRVGDMAAKTFVVGKAHTGPVVVPGLATAGAGYPGGPGGYGQPGAPGGQPWGGPPQQPASGPPTAWGGPPQGPPGGGYAPPGGGYAPPGGAGRPGGPPAAEQRPAPPGASTQPGGGAPSRPSDATAPMPPVRGSAPSGPSGQSEPGEAGASGPSATGATGPSHPGEPGAGAPGGEPADRTRREDDAATGGAPAGSTAEGGTAESAGGTPTAAGPAPSAGTPGSPGAATPAGTAQQPAAGGYNPQWDAARGTYIVWEPNRGQWLGWDEAAQEWKPL